jgi:hypothetical protein
LGRGIRPFGQYENDRSLVVGLVVNVFNIDRVIFRKELSKLLTYIRLYEI